VGGGGTRGFLWGLFIFVLVSVVRWVGVVGLVFGSGALGVGSMA
jgi:hypothetical protein